MGNNNETWSEEILKYLYQRYSYSNVRLNEFIVELLNLNVEDIQDAHLVNKYLKELNEKKIIEYFPNPSQKIKEDNRSVSKIGTIDSTFPGTISNYHLDVRLTFDGYNFVSNLLREKRQERNISIQTALTRISTLFVAASVFISIVSLFKECNSRKRGVISISVKYPSIDSQIKFTNSTQDTASLKKEFYIQYDSSQKK